MGAKSASRTYEPPLTPCLMVRKPSLSNVLRASRTVVRLVLNILERSCSEESRSPGFNCSEKMAPLICFSIPRAILDAETEEKNSLDIFSRKV